MISLAQPSSLHWFVGEWTYGVAGSNVLNEKDDSFMEVHVCMAMLGVKQSGRCPNRQLSKCDWEKHMQQKVTEVNSDHRLVSLQNIMHVLSESMLRMNHVVHIVPTSVKVTFMRT